jgi:c-di-GMP-related signal transduction protein
MKILSNVNFLEVSPYQKIKSIKQAIKVLGDSEIKQIALNQLIYNNNLMARGVITSSSSTSRSSIEFAVCLIADS